jgi:hypothetical protein
MSEHQGIKCGCPINAQHNINCAVITNALQDHLGRCGWRNDMRDCAQLELHIARAEWNVNGEHTTKQD